jgi:hypothetical protein
VKVRLPDVGEEAGTGRLPAGQFARERARSRHVGAREVGDQPKWSRPRASTGRPSFWPIASAMSWKVIPSAPTA